MNDHLHPMFRDILNTAAAGVTATNEAQPKGGGVMSAFDKKQMDAMVNRFLGWKLPKTFGPDAGIKFVPSNGMSREEAYEKPGWWPIGTNLLTADEARAMLEYVLEAADDVKPWDVPGPNQPNPPLPRDIGVIGGEPQNGTCGVLASSEVDRVLMLIAEYGRAEYNDGSHNTEETQEHKERLFSVLSAVIRGALGAQKPTGGEA